MRDKRKVLNRMFSERTMKMKSYKSKLIIFLLLIIMIFAVGCGSSKDPQSSAANEDDKKTSEESEATEEESKEEGEEKSDTENGVADASEMVEAEDVVEDWMVPIYADSLKDGTYPINVASSSSMFKIESAELTVANGEMTCVMTMGGKGYRYLFMGTGEEALNADEASFILPEEDANGAHTYTVPVTALDEGIPCTAFSNKKEKWYDRTLAFRSDSLSLDAFDESLIVTPASLGLEDGEYQAEITLSGGSGRVTIDSPTKLVISEGTCIATITWSSPNYDYMLVDGEKYLPINTEGNSVFEIPVKAFDRQVPVIGDTIAMSEPHEVDYTIFIDSSTIK